ncbi:hypothetical protein [Alteribacillus iranensis]|uniref:Uncharacterized protein n=1 Tax=Alteribacillus iranensis TaxID=930128 RepID=A0A1I2E6B9_9BACI|nr:hypothetical protein [Alteribacillus iranensis]SFE88233.1 hypothetical protein SAMN05192532_105123 [Alteribacillus iranensis]
MNLAKDPHQMFAFLAEDQLLMFVNLAKDPHSTLVYLAEEPPTGEQALRGEPSSL